MTQEEIIAKFKNNSRQVLSDNKMNSVIEAVNELDKIRDITELTELTIA